MYLCGNSLRQTDESSQLQLQSNPMMTDLSLVVQFSITRSSVVLTSSSFSSSFSPLLVLLCIVHQEEVLTSKYTIYPSIWQLILSNIFQSQHFLQSKISNNGFERIADSKLLHLFSDSINQLVVSYRMLSKHLIFLQPKFIAQWKAKLSTRSMCTRSIQAFF